jgi:hypothetical protein
MDRWPLMMLRRTAAAYSDLSENAFVTEVAKGRLPQATLLGGRHHWYRPALDKALAHIAGENLADYDREFWAKGEAA